MVPEIATSLANIKQAIFEINGFLPGSKDYFEFKKDVKTKRAVERNIEIIGEAVHRILKVDSQFQLTNARKIVDTRNRISHGYDTVSEEILWAIVNRDIPTLEIEVNLLLDTLKASIQEGIGSGIDKSFDPESHLASLKDRKTK
jgi:uncharacterized protein with HEPN domain